MPGEGTPIAVMGKSLGKQCVRVQVSMCVCAYSVMLRVAVCGWHADD